MDYCSENQQDRYSFKTVIFGLILICGIGSVVGNYLLDTPKTPCSKCKGIGTITEYVFDKTKNRNVAKITTCPRCKGYGTDPMFWSE